MLSPFNLTILSRLFRHQYVNCYVDYSLSHCTHAHFDIKERTQDKLTIAWRWITCYFRIPSKMKTLLFVVRRKNITPLLLFPLKSTILICYFSLAAFILDTEYPSETGYPLDNSRQTDNSRLNLKNGTLLILDGQATWLYLSVSPSILTDFEDGAIRLRRIIRL